MKTGMEIVYMETGMKCASRGCQCEGHKPSPNSIMLHPSFCRPSEKPTASAERALATISILQQENTLRGCRFPFHCTTLQPCDQPSVDITTPAVGLGRVTCVSLGICANDGCDYTAEVEPDQDRAGA
jgi:hypothetical protein